MIIGPFYDAATCQACLSKIQLLWPNRGKIGTAEDPVATVRQMWAEVESNPPEMPLEIVNSGGTFSWFFSQKEVEKFLENPPGLGRLPLTFILSARLRETRGKLPAKNWFRVLLDALERGDFSSDGLYAWMVLSPDPKRSSEGFKNPDVASFRLDGRGYAFDQDPVSGFPRPEAARVTIRAAPEAPTAVRELIVKLAPEMAANPGEISCKVPWSDQAAVFAAFTVFESVARTHKPGAPMAMGLKEAGVKAYQKTRYSDLDTDAVVKEIETIVAFATQPIAGKWSFDLWAPSESILLGTAWDRRGTLFEAHPTFYQMEEAQFEGWYKPILALRYKESAYAIEFHGLKNDPALKPIKPLLDELIEMVR